ncbi:ferredoxin [Streptomyces sp. FXJ1.4098]|nr:ferredoxin [Streptomyces sp. FXJ1.4098]
MACARCRCDGDPPAEASVPTVPTDNAADNAAEDTAERPTRKKGATVKVTVDEDKCCAAGSCVLAAPDVFDQRDEDGIVVLLDAEPAEPAEPAEDQHAAVRDAAAVCPAAIALSDV